MFQRLSLSSVLFLFVLAGLPASAQQAHEHQPEKGDPEKLGRVRFEHSCRPAAAAPFERGVAMLHSFWYEQAARTFEEAAGQDPACAIAWWGVAMAHWHPLWEPQGPNRPDLEAGRRAVTRARDAETATPRERAYIDAIAAFYTDHEKVPHLQRVQAYEKAMEQLHARYPQDTEAAIFYALALQGTAVSTTPPDKSYARQRKSGAILEPLLARQPDHPGVAHYIIHAYDYPALARGGLDAARRYAEIAPDSPHARHMPSHIFTRLGLWEESIASNRAVIEAARKWGVIGEEMHARDYLTFAHLQRAEDQEARKVIDQMADVDALAREKGTPLYFAGMYARAAAPARYALERRQWADAAALPVPGDFPRGRYAWAEATLRFARALGAARSGDTGSAPGEIARLQELRRALVEAGEPYWADQVEVQRRAAAAWLDFAHDRRDEAISGMRHAVELSESMDKHPVTPGDVIPARALLGDMLQEAGKPKEAQAEFEKLLDREPGRFLALYGAGRAAEAAGDAAAARVHYRSLLDLAADAGGERDELRHASDFLRKGGGVTQP